MQPPKKKQPSTSDCTLCAILVSSWFDFDASLRRNEWSWGRPLQSCEQQTHPKVPSTFGIHPQSEAFDLPIIHQIVVMQNVKCYIVEIER